MPRPEDLTEEEADLLSIALPTEADAQAEASRRERMGLRAEMLANLMRSELFREWLWEVLDGFGTFENSFGAGPTGFPDHAATQFKLGMKASGWHLWETFDNIAPDMASLMRREGSGVTPKTGI